MTIKTKYRIIKDTVDEKEVFFVQHFVGIWPFGFWETEQYSPDLSDFIDIDFDTLKTAESWIKKNGREARYFPKRGGAMGESIENRLLCFLARRIKLAGMDPGVFEAIAEKFIMTGIEVVVMRKNPQSNEVEVLMTKRADDDKIWPGALHIPGSILRKSDNSYQDALERVAKKELGVSGFKRVTFVGPLFYRDEGYRGNNHGLIFLCELVGIPLGEFYPVNKLNRYRNKNSPIEDIGIIEMALEEFEAQESAAP
jgi:hypothetical protein